MCKDTKEKPYQRKKGLQFGYDCPFHSIIISVAGFDGTRLE